jgi:hypothetical protein
MVLQHQVDGRQQYITSHNKCTRVNVVQYKDTVSYVSEYINRDKLLRSAEVMKTQRVVMKASASFNQHECRNDRTQEGTEWMHKMVYRLEFGSPASSK